MFLTEFVADALVNDTVPSLPSACGPFDGNPLAQWIASYRAVEALDFDVLLTGHGAPLLDKTAVRETREFFEYLRDAFDVHYAEGLERPSMMSIGMHCRILGKPARLKALQRFLDHVQGHADVWICRRIDIRARYASGRIPAYAPRHPATCTAAMAVASSGLAKRRFSRTLAWNR